MKMLYIVMAYTLVNFCKIIGYYVMKIVKMS